MAERLPRQLGDYLLLHGLGSGGMGKVYLARKHGAASIARYCVIKTMRTEGDRDKAQRFLDEARLVVHLNHKNICTVSDVGFDGGTLYLVMDLVAGRDVEAVRVRVRDLTLRISFSAAMMLIRELLEALDYAHRLQHPVTGAQLGLVHRDVSPQNVMISFEGEVKLIDFGLAASSQKHAQTKAGFVLGKLQYLAPEQVRQEPVDARADQFAAAVLAYEVFSGGRYYEDLTQDEIWRAIVDDDYEPAMWSSIDPDVGAVLSRALRRDKDKRFPTCAAFRQALEQVYMERQLTGGTDELRVLMRRLFPEGPDKQRSLLQRYASVQTEAALAAALPVELPDLDPMTTGEGAPLSDIADEPTIIQSDTDSDGAVHETWVAPEPLPATIPSVDLRTIEEISRTEQVRIPNRDKLAPHPAQPSTGVPKLALAALALPLVLGAAVLAWSLGRTDPPVTTPDPARVAVTAPDAGAEATGVVAADASNTGWQVMDDSDAGEGAVNDEGVTQADGGSLIDAGEDDGGVDDATPDKPTRRRARRGSRRRPPAATTSPPKRDPPTSTGEKLKLLKSCRAPCARRLVKRRTQGKNLDVVALKRYLNAVDACVLQCL